MANYRSITFKLVLRRGPLNPLFVFHGSHVAVRVIDDLVQHRCALAFHIVALVLQEVLVQSLLAVHVLVESLEEL